MSYTRRRHSEANGQEKLKHNLRQIGDKRLPDMSENIFKLLTMSGSHDRKPP